MVSKRCSRRILKISWRGFEALPLPSVENSEDLLKQLLIAGLLILLAKMGCTDQRSAGAAFERAAAAFNQGKFAEAEIQIDAAEKLDPKKPEVPNLRGAIFIRQKRYDDAAQQFNEALALDPKFYPAKLNLAEVNLLQGKYADAAHLYQELKQLDPGSELLEFKMMLCALLGGEESRAATMVDVMKFPGKTPAYYYARAAIALERGQKETAQKYLANARKYYTDAECAYFAQSLKEVDFTGPRPAQPLSTPDRQPQ
jgi:tetratricopeptide (TPR) repeat protein